MEGGINGGLMGGYGVLWGVMGCYVVLGMYYGMEGGIIMGYRGVLRDGSWD